MRSLSIKTKIILSTCLVVGAVFGGFGEFIYQQVRTAYRERLDARLQGHAEKLREEIEEQYLEHRFPNEADLRSLRTEGLSDLLLRLSDSTSTPILVDSALRSRAMKPWNQIIQSEFLLEDEHIAHREYRILWAPVEALDRYQYSVQIAAPLSEVEANLALLRVLLLISIPAALILCGFAVYGIVNRAFRPLSGMIRTAERISASNLGERLLLPKSNDEVFKLVLTFNTMMQRIESAFRGQKQFVADASHEIRTPLTIIGTELEYAQRSVTDKSSHESLNIALAEVDRLKKLSDDLLLLAKLESPVKVLTLRKVRLDELLADCVRSLKPLSDKRRIVLDLHVDGALELEADEDKLRSAILNLIDNAMKYSADGGTVEIDQRTLDKEVELCIRDRGEGIPAEDIKDIFERFHRAASSRPAHDGSGLGLAIVRRIIELHYGSVSVHSVPGEGSTFTVLLPRKTSHQRI